MIYSTDFVEMAGKISHIEIVKYLSDLGWKEIKTKRPLVRVFQLEKDEQLYQVDIPTSRELRDYKRAMYNAIEGIADSCKKSTEQVLLELLNPLSDIIRIQIKDASASSGTIFVEDAIKLYDNAKKLVAATAMDVRNPKIYHLGKPDSVVQEFVSNCRFGQTEIGSYIISLVCPIANIKDEKYTQLNLFGEESEKVNSLTRKITKKLITSIQEVKEAIDKGTFNEKILQPRRIRHDDKIDMDKTGQVAASIGGTSGIEETGTTEDNSEVSVISTPISANFLDAIGAIGIYKEATEVNISIKWAPTIQSNIASVDNVTISHDYFTPINTVVQDIKNKLAEEKGYIGKISKLYSTIDAETRSEGEITIIFLNENNVKTTAHVWLKKADYDHAIEAHLQGDYVKVTGRLSGQRSKKIDYTGFEVLP